MNVDRLGSSIFYRIGLPSFLFDKKEKGLVLKL